MTDELEVAHWVASEAFDLADAAGEIMAWVNANGGEVSYLPVGRIAEATGQKPLIGIRKGDGFVYAAPGQYVVRVKDGFDVCAHDPRPTGEARQLAAFSQWIDDSYPVALCEEAVSRRRVDKTCEEAGEALKAFGGVVGENPRKGVFGTMDDVVDELLDTAVAALGAVEHLTGNRGTALGQLMEKIRYVHTRAGLGSD